MRPRNNIITTYTLNLNESDKRVPFQDPNQLIRFEFILERTENTNYRCFTFSTIAGVKVGRILTKWRKSVEWNVVARTEHCGQGIGFATQNWKWLIGSRKCDGFETRTSWTLSVSGKV
jgi:hypothetical protein